MIAHLPAGLSREHRLIWVGGGIVLLLAAVAIAAPDADLRVGLLHSPDEQDSAGLDDDGDAGPAVALPTGNRSNGAGHSRPGCLRRTGFAHRRNRGDACRHAHRRRESGLLAGFYGPELLETAGSCGFTDMNLSLPAILLAIAFAAVMDGRVWFICIPRRLPWHFLDVRLERGIVSLLVIIGFVSWPGMVRVVRGQVLEVKERQFVQAARALGASNTRLVWRHILPNILPTIIVLAAMNTANTILLEAGLGYLGVGVPEPAATWGSMIADGQAYFVTAPHIVIVPGMAILVTVLALNLLGQGLQEALETRRR